MALLSKYRTVIIVSAIVIILVLVRALSIGHFKNNAKAHAMPSFNRAILISEEQINTLAGDILPVRLDGAARLLKNLSDESINVTVDSVLDKASFSKIYRHKGPVLLISSDAAVSARVWMILSQMGCMDVFILTDNPDNEVFKNKFRPDSLNRPEL